ncbi:MAG TPA: cytochrome c-type biogenesis protein [Pyrinomonadaceae bacterium]|jgi:cytochrome c-type biogenesis protein CcmH
MNRLTDRGRLARLLRRGRCRTKRASRPRTEWLLVLLLLTAPYAFAKDAQPVGDDPALEQRLQKLSQELRCLVCQNETLADSRADLAEDLRREIREQMRAGKSDKEIIAFLTERYGQFILYRPRVTPTTYLLWFGPFVLLLAGLAVLFRYIKQRRDLIPELPLTAEERRRAEELLRSGSRKETA